MSEKAKAHKYRKALWKGSIKVALIITVVILFFLGRYFLRYFFAFFDYHTEVKCDCGWNKLMSDIK